MADTVEQTNFKTAVIEWLGGEVAGRLPVGIDTNSMMIMSIGIYFWICVDF